MTPYIIIQKKPLPMLLADIVDIRDARVYVPDCQANDIHLIRSTRRDIFNFTDIANYHTACKEFSFKANLFSQRTLDDIFLSLLPLQPPGYILASTRECAQHAMQQDKHHVIIAITGHAPGLDYDASTLPLSHTFKFIDLDNDTITNVFMSFPHKHGPFALFHMKSAERVRIRRKAERLANKIKNPAITIDEALVIINELLTSLRHK